MEVTQNIFDIVKQSPQKPYREFFDGWEYRGRYGGNYSSMYQNGFIFKQYPSFKSSFDFIEEVRANPTTYEESSSALYRVSNSYFNNYDSFINVINSDNQDDIEAKKVSTSILENIKSFIKLGGLYQNDKIQITEDKRGVFDFGLASLGLYRPIEFYSEELKNDIESKKVQNPFKISGNPNGVINPNDVKKNSFGNNIIYTYRLDNKNYQCERRQRGATDVFNKFYKECDLKSNNDGIILTYYKNSNRVFNGKGKVRLKYASSNKKSYLIYNKKDDDVRYVDLFMPINFLGSANSTTALAFLPMYLIAGALEDFGIQSRISALRIGSDNQTNVAISIPVKEYNESTKEAFNRSFNLLAKQSVAGSYFAFHKIITENEGVQAPPTGSSSSAFRSVYYEERKYMNDMMQRYKNWAEINRDKNFINTKVANSNFQFAMYQEMALPDAEGSVITTEAIFSNLHNVFFKFYYYMDFLALEMLSMQEFVKAIYRRFVDDESFLSLFEIPSSTKDKQQLIRDYTLSMLNEKYALVQGGAYSDSIEQEVNKTETKEQKLRLLDEAIQSIA